MQVVTTAQMRELDRRTIELGTPGLTLMERAGAGVVKLLLASYRAACRRGVLIVAGRGNNGGDGFVVARLLRAKKIRATVALLGKRERVSGDAQTNLERWVKQRGRLLEIVADDDLRALDREIARAGVLVDAIFGTGLNAEVTGPAAAAIERMNLARSVPRAPAIVAVDLPSGLDGDTGEPWGTALRADLTVTFAAAKVGMVLPAARDHVGRLEVVDIGIAAEAKEALGPPLEAMSDTLVRALLPSRRGSAHKGTHGHVLVVAGSYGKSGAAILAARGAIRGGAGLTTVVCSRDVLPIVAAALPEAMTEPFPSADDASAWDALVRARSALVLGPGLGQGAEAVEVVRRLVRTVALPMVVDADGLNALVGDLDALRSAAGARVLTPHPGEMARLVGSSVPDVQRARLERARQLARETGAVVVLKGAGTITAAPDGRASVNTTGGPLLGSGGSGDVLAGLIGSLLAQGLAPYDAGRAGAFLHGRAADRLAERLGDAGLLASELADALPPARAALAHASH